MKDKISVFLPVYNEEKILENNVNKVYNEFKKLKIPFEIFIVDDNSNDNTPLISKKLAKNKLITYLRYNNGPSRRENLFFSFKKANGNIIVFMDIDLATDISHIPQLINEIKKGNDIAIGSRYILKYLKKPKIFYPYETILIRKIHRKIMSIFYSHLIRLYFNSKIYDHQCGFKAFKKETITELIEEAGFDHSYKRGWFLDTEILLRAQKKKKKIIEFPVTWRHGKKTAFKLVRELRMTPYVLKLKFRLK